MWEAFCQLNWSNNGMADPRQMLVGSVYLDIYPHLYGADVEPIVKRSR